MNNCWIIIFSIITIIVIIVIYRYQTTKCNFINGMWTNSNEDMYIYIDNKEKDGWRGGYIVSQKHNVNEPFKIKSKIGVSDDVIIETKKSNFLKKKMTSRLSLADGVIEVTDKKSKKYKLYKDTETTEKMKKN